MEIWRWTTSFVNGFSMEAGLIPGLLAELRLKGAEKQIFIIKAAMIHSMFRRIQDAEAETERKCLK